MNDVLTINDSDVGGGGGSGFQFTVNTDPGRVSDLAFDAYGTGYVATDVLENQKQLQIFHLMLLVKQQHKHLLQLLEILS